MVDIHTHILPGVDDGAKDMAASLEMARIAVGDGIDTMVATPHAVWISDVNTGPAIRGGLADLCAALSEARIPLTVLPGAEVPMQRNLAARLLSDRSWTIGGAGVYLLLEPPWGPIPDFAFSLIEELVANGLTPIIAHPERNAALLARPEMLVRMIEAGCLTQVTGNSLLGKHGGKAREFGWQLVEQGNAHILSSDAHNAENRAPVLSAARDAVADRMGEQIARRLCEETPRQVVEGLPVVFTPAEATGHPQLGDTEERRESGLGDRLRRLFGRGG